MKRFEIYLDDGTWLFEGVQYQDGDFAGRIFYGDTTIWACGHDLNTITKEAHTTVMIDEHN